MGDPATGRIFAADMSECIHALKCSYEESQLYIYADEVLKRWTTSFCLLDPDTVCGVDKFENLYINRLPAGCENEAEDDMEDMMESASDGMEEDVAQVTIGEYTTRHFDMCPSATALYKDISNKTDMIHLVVESLMLHDLLFKLERQAISMDAADEDMVMKAQHYADMIMGIATEMDLVEDHSYVQGHVDVIKELTNSDSTMETMIESDDMEEMSDITEYDDMMPPSARMMKEQQNADKKG